MSDDIQKAIEAVGDAAELDPIVDGLKKVAKFTADESKKTEKKLQDVEAKVEGKMAEISKKLTSYNETNEKGMSDILDRMDVLAKRSSFSHRIDQDDMSAVKSAIPERFRKNWSAYEAAARRNGKDASYEEVIKFAVQDVFYKDASKIGMVRSFDFAEREAIQRELTDFTTTLAKISKADMGGAVNTSGGYAVPDIVGNEVLKIVRDASDIYNRARQIPMTSDTLSFPDENTAVTVNWVAEAGTLTQGEPVFGVKTLSAKKLVGRAVFSLELLDDANVAIVPFLQSCFAEKMGGELDFQAMEGPGTVFTGVQSAVSVGDCARTNGTNGVVLSYSSSTATIASLTQIFTKAGEGIARRDGLFVCGPGVYAKIIGLVDNNNQPVVRLGTVEGQPNNTLFGRPIIVTNRLPAYTVGAGTVSVGSLYYGPPSALLFGTRAGMRWDVTDQVHWGTYQGDARMVGRFGYVVGVPTAWAKQTGIII